MAGLIKQQMAEQKPQGGAQAAAPGEAEQAPDQIDEAVDRVVEAGRTMLYDENGFATVMEQLQSGADMPAETLGNVAYTLTMTLDEKSGGTIPEEALIPAAIQLLDEVIKLAEDAGVMQVDEDTAARAVQVMVSLAIENGIIDPEDIEAMMAEMDPEEMQAMVAEQDRIAQGGQAN